MFSQTFLDGDTYLYLLVNKFNIYPDDELVFSRFSDRNILTFLIVGGGEDRGDTPKSKKKSKDNLWKW